MSEPNHPLTHLRRAAVAAAFALLGAAPAAAEIYRWVDENGVVNYTERKPYGVAAQRISTLRGGPSLVTDVPAEDDADQTVTSGTDAAAAEPQGGDLSDAQRKMLEGLQAAEAARQAEIARIRDANCARARSVLERLQSGAGRLRVRDDSGNETVMAEEERSRRIAEAQRGVAANCSA